MSSPNTEPIELVTEQRQVKVIIRPFKPARVDLEARGVFLRYSSVETSGFKGKTKDQITEQDSADAMKMEDSIPAEILEEINDITIKHMVISVNGQTENVLELCKDQLTEPDYAAVLKKCNEIGGLSDEKKKDSDSNTPSS